MDLPLKRANCLTGTPIGKRLAKCSVIDKQIASNKLAANGQFMVDRKKLRCYSSMAMLAYEGRYKVF